MPVEDQINGLYNLKEYLVKNPIELNGYKSLPITLIDYAIEALEQQPKTGHWISHHHGCEYECSECHDKQRAKSNYCPNCGCCMVEPQESEE